MLLLLNSQKDAADVTAWTIFQIEQHGSDRYTLRWCIADPKTIIGMPDRHGTWDDLFTPPKLTTLVRHPGPWQAGRAAVPSAMPFQVVRYAMLEAGHPDQWATVDNVAVYRKEDPDHDQHVEVQRRCDARTPDAMLAELANVAGDTVADVYAAITARYIAEYAPAEGIVANVDDILRDRGLAPVTKRSDHYSHGYRTEDRLAIGKAFEELTRWFLTGRLTSWQAKRGKKQQPLNISSVLLSITDTVTQTSFDGQEIPLVIRAVLGEYTRHFLTSGAGRQTALLMQQALRYDPHNEQVEKRLAYHLAFHWREASHSRTYDQPMLLSRLLQEARIDTGGPTQRKFPGRAIDRWVHALDTLKRDGVIAHYEFLPGKDDAPRSKPDRWLAQKIAITPPEWVPKQYWSLGVHNPRLRALSGNRLRTVWRIPPGSLPHEVYKDYCADRALARGAAMRDSPNSDHRPATDSEVSPLSATTTNGPAAPPAQPQLYALDALLAAWEQDATAAHDAYTTGQQRGPVTSLPTVDKDLGGFLAPGVHVAHGSPGVGKTAWALQTAAECGCPALFVTTEMGALELFRRVTARATGTFLGKLKSGELEPAHSLALARQAAKAVPMLALADATQCFAAPAWLQAAASGLRARYQAAHLLMVVDSVHSWSEQAASNVPEYDRLNAALLALGSLARSLDVPILAVAERNRASMSVGGLSASAGSRKFEYAAETVFDLNREKDTPPDAAGEAPLTLQIQKNRNGSAGRSIRRAFALAPTPALPSAEAAAPTEDWRRIWDAARPLAGTVGTDYLTGRGIPLEHAAAAGARYGYVWRRPAVLSISYFHTYLGCTPVSGKHKLPGGPCRKRQFTGISDSLYTTP